MPLDALPSLSLAHGLDFEALYTAHGATEIDARFLTALRESDGALADRLITARANPDALGTKEHSELLIALGPYLEDFLAHLFGITPDVRALESRHHELAPIFTVKRQFVQRKAMNAHKADVAATFDGHALHAAL